MSARHRMKLGIGVILGLTVAAAVTVVLVSNRKPLSSKPAVVEFNESTPMKVLSDAVKESDGRALAVLLKKVTPPADTPPPAWTDEEGAQWIDALNAIRVGYLKFGSFGKVTAVTVAGRTIQRFSVDPAPRTWIKAVRPTHDILSAGLADANLDVRVTALVEVGKIWSWIPGRTASETEEYTIASWKDGFVPPVVRRLADSEPKARAAAVSCLGYHPYNRVAAPAMAYLEDPVSADVRKQTLISFAMRPGLLTVDMILRHMYDQDASVAETAALVLKTRGLSQEQVSLGSMIFHPKPEIRASVIPLLKERTDIDPVVWLLQLSQDSDEAVRIGAIDALAARKSPEVDKRMAEMAATDKSAAVRKAASKHLLPEVDKTASLPPLPGSSSLNPKAN